MTVLLYASHINICNINVVQNTYMMAS